MTDEGNKAYLIKKTLVHVKVCVCVCSPRIYTLHQVIINVITAIIISSNIIALTNVVAIMRTFSRGEQKLLILILFFKNINLTLILLT